MRKLNSQASYLEELKDLIVPDHDLEEAKNSLVSDDSNTQERESVKSLKKNSLAK